MAAATSGPSKRNASQTLLPVWLRYSIAIVSSPRQTPATVKCRSGSNRRPCDQYARSASRPRLTPSPSGSSCAATGEVKTTSGAKWAAARRRHARSNRASTVPRTRPPPWPRREVSNGCPDRRRVRPGRPARARPGSAGTRRRPPQHRRSPGLWRAIRARRRPRSALPDLRRSTTQPVCPADRRRRRSTRARC